MSDLDKLLTTPEVQEPQVSAYQIILGHYKDLSDVKYGNIDDRSMAESISWDWLHTLVLKPKQLMKYKIGTCWDQSLYTYAKLKEEFGTNNVKAIGWWLTLLNGRTQSHTTIIVKDGDKYYWSEHAWEEFSGIHGAYESFGRAIREIKSHAPKHKSVLWRDDISKAYDKLLKVNGNINAKMFVKEVFGIDF